MHHGLGVEVKSRNLQPAESWQKLKHAPMLASVAPGPMVQLASTQSLSLRNGLAPTDSEIEGAAGGGA